MSTEWTTGNSSHTSEPTTTARNETVGHSSTQTTSTENFARSTHTDAISTGTPAAQSTKTRTEDQTTTVMPTTRPTLSISTVQLTTTSNVSIVTKSSTAAEPSLPPNHSSTMIPTLSTHDNSTFQSSSPPIGMIITLYNFLHVFWILFV